MENHFFLDFLARQKILTIYLGLFLALFFFEDTALSAQTSASRPIEFLAFIDIPQAAQLSITQYLENPLQEPQGKISPENHRGYIRSWLNHLQQKGATLIGLEVFNLEGDLFYPSRALETVGFNFKKEFGDLLKIVCEEAKILSLKLNIGIEGLAHILEKQKSFSSRIHSKKIKPALIEAVIKELAEYQKKYEVPFYINEEAFQYPYIQLLDKACKDHHIRYHHFFDEPHGLADIYVSEDYAIFPQQAEDQQEDLDYWISLSKIGVALSTIGHLNIMYGHAQTIGKASGCLTSGGWGLVNERQPNMMLMRSVQFMPELYSLICASYDDREVDSEEVRYSLNFDFRSFQKQVERFGRKLSDTPKKIANLVIVQGTDAIADEYEDLVQSIISIASCAILAAGYELLISYDKPLSKADIYYIVAPATYEQTVDLPDSFFKLSASKVIFHPAGFPHGASWQKLLHKMNAKVMLEQFYSDTKCSPIPKTVSFDFGEGSKEIRFRGHYPWIETSNKKLSILENQFMTGIVAKKSPLIGKMDTDLDGTPETSTAIIFQEGSFYFINGVFLHLDFVSILTNFLSESPVYNTNSYGYLTIGKDRSVFLAAADTLLDVNLPGGQYIFEFNAKGEEVPSSIKLEKNRLSGAVKKWHLVIITNA